MVNVYKPGGKLNPEGKHKDRFVTLPGAEDDAGPPLREIRRLTEEEAGPQR
jgi:hypothetical protein